VEVCDFELGFDIYFIFYIRTNAILFRLPVLAGAAAYAIAEASAWRGTLEVRPRLAKKFYGVVGAAMIIGLILNYAGFNAVKMLFWAAVLNGVLAPPLIVLVVLLTSNKKIMGKRTNPAILKWFGWATAAIMVAAAIAMFATM
jgi:Mn2+/Fe2+ NRAMP family transporter